MSGLVVSIDAGTTALKVGVFDVDRGLVGLARREQQLDRRGADRCEQAVDATTALIIGCLRELGSYADLKAVTGIAVAGQRGTVLALDAQGTPITPYVTWMDRRGLPFLDDVIRLVGADDYYTTAGHPVVPVTGVSKVLALHADPAIPESARITPQQTHLLAWLGADDLVCDRSTGSFHFPMRPRSEGWSEDIAASIGFPLDRLPRLVGSTEVVGSLRRAVADATGLPEGIAVVAGGGDGQCAGAGTATMVAGDVLVNIGTAAGVLVPLTEPVRDPAGILNCAAYVIPGTWEAEGHTQASGIAVDWFRDRVGGLGIDEVSALAMEAPPAADGLIFVPTLNGATAPLVESRLGAAFVGIRLHHDRRHLARAVLEGVCLEIDQLLRAIRAIGGQVGRIRVSGGATRSRAWMQVLADVIGWPIRVVEPPDAALTGAAMCAAVGVGAASDMPTAAGRFVREASMYEPQPAYEGAYSELRTRYAIAFDGLVSSVRTAPGRVD